MSSIHGHEVLEMMIASNESYSRASLIHSIQTKFGVDARFHTCSKDNMDAAELVNFLEAKGKFVPKQDGFTTEASKICQH